MFLLRSCRDSWSSTGRTTVSMSKEEMLADEATEMVAMIEMHGCSPGAIFKKFAVSTTRPPASVLMLMRSASSS